MGDENQKMLVIYELKSIRTHEKNHICLSTNYITMDYPRFRSHSKRRICMVLCIIYNVVWNGFHFLRCIKLEKKTINIGPCCIFD